MRRTLTGIVVLTAMMGAATAADYGSTPPDLGYHHFSHKALPTCDDPSVVATIPEKFAYYDARVIGSGLSITGIDAIQENALRAGGPSLVDRRYCGATAWLSNGQLSEVYYIIEGPKLGFASIAWHVESCLPGFDPYRVYDARCRSIRP